MSIPELSGSERGAHEEEILRLKQERESAEADRDRALGELKAVRKSARYRAGGIVVWLPSRVRALRRRIARLRNSARGEAGTTTDVSWRARPVPFRAPLGAVSPPRVQQPDVTVVIPVYNSETWLDDCLSSVLAQSGVDIEVVCINDGSTDLSRQVLERFADADSRVSIIDQANQGQSVGRNVGLDAAAGRYIIYLDSDDFWPDDTLASLVSKADRENLDALLFDCFAFLDGDVADATWKRYSTYYQRKAEYSSTRPGAEMVADMRRNRDYRPHVGMYIARTSFVRSAGIRFIPGIIHQDNPYTFSLLLNAARVAHTGAEIYARRIRPGSTITALRDSQSVKGYFLSYVAMVREIQGRVFSQSTSALLAEVIEGVFNAAAKKVSTLTPAELGEVRALDCGLDAQLVIERFEGFCAR